MPGSRSITRTPPASGSRWWRRAPAGPSATPHPAADDTARAGHRHRRRADGVAAAPADAAAGGPAPPDPQRPGAGRAPRRPPPLGGTIAALVWTNVDAGSYDSLWGTQVSLRLGSFRVSQDLHGWVNSGLMTFFFLVIGLEARRQFDMGELRERRRFAVPLVAGLG